MCQTSSPNLSVELLSSQAWGSPSVNTNASSSTLGRIPTTLKIVLSTCLPVCLPYSYSLMPAHLSTGMSTLLTDAFSSSGSPVPHLLPSVESVHSFWHNKITKVPSLLTFESNGCTATVWPLSNIINYVFYHPSSPNTSNTQLI